MTTAAKKTAAKKAADKPKSEAEAKDNGTEDDKPKRKSFTPEEKIAKLQDEIAATRIKAQEKRDKAVEKLNDEIAKLKEKHAEDGRKIAEKEAERDRLSIGASITGDDVEGGDQPDPVVEASDAAAVAAPADDDS